METIDKEKMVARIMATHDDYVLSEINALLGLAGGDFWDTTSETTKAAIERGRADALNGFVRSNAEVMDEIKSKYRK